MKKTHPLLLIIRFISFFYSLLPRKLQISLGKGLGTLLYLFKFKEKIVRQNLKYAYPEEDRLRERIFRESYLHLGNLFLEILLLFARKGKAQKSFIEKYVDFEGSHFFRTAQDQGKSVLFLSSHLGNWEIMGGAGALFLNSDLMLVTKHLKPEWLHLAIEEGRRASHLKATYEPKTMKDILHQFKKKAAVGFVLDQYAGPPVGVRVPLFGIPVSTSLAVATLVKRSGAVVLPVENYRKPDGRWSVVVSAPVEWISHSDSHYELALNTANYTALLEKHIRKHPEQWLWIHRRFKGDLSPLKPEEWLAPRTRR